MSSGPSAGPSGATAPPPTQTSSFAGLPKLTAAFLTSTYTAEAAILRLLFAGKVLSERGDAEGEACLQAGLTLVTTTTHNAKWFRDFRSALGNPVSASDAWLSDAEEGAKAAVAHVEARLSESRAAGESRAAQRALWRELADAYMSSGGWKNAQRAAIRARDFGGTANKANSFDDIVAIIRAVVPSRDLGPILSLAAKVRSSPSDQNADSLGADPLAVVKGKIRAAGGLAHMSMRSYKAAARGFLDVAPGIEDAFSSVLSMADIALYGALTALASFDRVELKGLLNSPSFKPFLELVPVVRDIVADFYDCNYHASLSALTNIRDRLELDVHLAPHIESLYSSIRSKALIQYFSPFSTVDLARMADAFSSSVEGISEEVAALIVQGDIQARIDAENGILIASQDDLRSSTFSAALKTGAAFERQSKALLLRVRMAQAGFAVSSPNAKAGKPGVGRKSKDTTHQRKKKR